MAAKKTAPAPTKKAPKKTEGKKETKETNKHVEEEAPKVFDVKMLSKDGFSTFNNFKAIKVDRLQIGGENFRILDELMGTPEDPGFAKHQLYLVSGSGNAGKTTLLTQIAGHLAKQNVLFCGFAPDSDKAQMSNLRSRLDIPSPDFIIDNLLYSTSEDQTSEQRLHQVSAMRQDGSAQGLLIKFKLQELRRKYPDAEIVIGVDSLQTACGNKRGHELHFVSELVSYASELHMTIFILCEETAKGKFTGYQSLTNKANYIKIDVVSKDHRRISVEKNRFGRTGAIYSELKNEGHFFQEERPLDIVKDGKRSRKTTEEDNQKADDLLS